MGFRPKKIMQRFEMCSTVDVCCDVIRDYIALRWKEIGSCEDDLVEMEKKGIWTETDIAKREEILEHIKIKQAERIALKLVLYEILSAYENSKKESLREQK